MIGSFVFNFAFKLYDTWIKQIANYVLEISLLTLAVINVTVESWVTMNSKTSDKIGVSIVTMMTVVQMIVMVLC